MARKKKKPPQKPLPNLPNDPQKDLPKEPPIPKKSWFEHPGMFVFIELLGVGLQMTSLQFLGIVLILVSTGGLWWIFLPQVAEYTRVAKKRLLWGGWAGILIFGAIYGWWVYSSSVGTSQIVATPQSQVSSANQSGGITANTVITGVPSPHVPKAISLVATYQFTTFPVSVAPGTTLYVLQLHPKLNVGFYSHENGGDTAISWPSEKDIHGLSPLDMIYRCDIQNLGEAPVLNAEMMFKIDFREAVEAPNQASGGNQQNSGPIVLSQNHHVSVGVLDVKDTFTFYIVNQSSLFAEVALPTTATAHIVGELERRTFLITRQKTGILDRLPLGFIPTTVKWHGLPE